jgi:hypothetical protein
MIKEGKLNELWDEHLQATATVFCQGSGSSIDGGAADERRRRGRFLQEDDYDNDRALTEDADASNNGHYIRHLIAGSSEGGGGGDEDIQTTQLTLQNMGGVFLLHGILSGLSLLCALISWSRKRYTKGTVRKESDGADGNEKSIMNDPASSIDHGEFFDDASTSAEEFRRKMGTNKPLENGSVIMIGNNNNSSDGAVDDLRMEIKQLKRIDEKLAALLDKKEQ